MTKFKYVVKSLNVLNGLLVLAVGAAAYETLVPYLDLKIQPILPPAGKVVVAPAALPLPGPEPTLHDYAVVSEKNLFHPQRRMPPEKDEKASQAPPVLPKPELTLFGTLIADDLSVAYVEDRKAPFSTPGRGPRQRALKKGDVIGGFVLKDIEADRIVLVRGGEQLAVMLDQKERKRSGDTVAAPAAPGSVQQPSGPAAAPATGPAGQRQRYPSPAMPRPAAPAALGAAPAANPGTTSPPTAGTGNGTAPEASPPVVVAPSADQGTSAATLDELYPVRPGAEEGSAIRPGARKRLYDIRPVPGFRH